MGFLDGIIGPGGIFGGSAGTAVEQQSTQDKLSQLMALSGGMLSASAPSLNPAHGSFGYGLGQGLLGMSAVRQSQSSNATKRLAIAQQKEGTDRPLSKIGKLIYDREKTAPGSEEHAALTKALAGETGIDLGAGYKGQGIMFLSAYARKIEDGRETTKDEDMMARVIRSDMSRASTVTTPEGIYRTPGMDMSFMDPPLQPGAAPAGVPAATATIPTPSAGGAPAGMPGGTVRIGAPKYSDAQNKAFGYAKRMTDTEDVFDRLERVGWTPDAGYTAAGRLPDDLAPWLRSEEGKLFDQATRNFINAQLRVESGAVISDAEFANAQAQYIPHPDDPPSVLAEKKRNRLRVRESNYISAGPGRGPADAALIGDPPRSGGKKKMTTEEYLRGVAN